MILLGLHFDKSWPRMIDWRTAGFATRIALKQYDEEECASQEESDDKERLVGIIMLNAAIMGFRALAYLL
jgi:hypothetical protein